MPKKRNKNAKNSGRGNSNSNDYDGEDDQADDEANNKRGGRRRGDRRKDHSGKGPSQITFTFMLKYSKITVCLNSPSHRARVHLTIGTFDCITNEESREGEAGGKTSQLKDHYKLCFIYNVSAKL